MAVSILNLAAGLAYLTACVAIGSAFLRQLDIHAPPYWYFPLAALSGVAAVNTCVVLALVFGGGVLTLRVLLAVILYVAAQELMMHSKVSQAFALAGSIVRERWIAPVVLVALGLNLLIALAPSTKIDEIYYHMLVPSRVVSDGGLRAYREPFESAIYPQMAFQYGLSVLYATGIPEAGNLLSWGLGAALIVFIVGTVSLLTREQQAGWLFGAIAVVGLYTAVWHVTSGAHALGDLATVIAVSLCLLPDTLVAWARPEQRLILICLAGCTAALTKISLLPICIAITLLAASIAVPHLGWQKSVFILTGSWVALYSPLLIWSAIHTGSPFGLATATLFHSRFFDASTFNLMAESRKINQIGLMNALQFLVLEVSPAYILALCIIVMGAWNLLNLRILLALMAGQIVLIALFLPHDFRFLGGLQFVVLIMASWALSFWSRGKHLLKRSALLVIPFCLPSLAVQAYYALPFIEVDLGLTTRDSFMNKYVAFRSDFQSLNKLLPKDAVLLVKNSRLPSIYAPRPVILTIKDAPADRPLYRFTVGEDKTSDNSIYCNELVYENRQAVSNVYRTPGRLPVREHLIVEHCAPASSSGSQSSLDNHN